MSAFVRPLERFLAVTGDMIRCPRKGEMVASGCIGCPFFCRNDRVTSSMVCSYPILAHDTFGRRSRVSETVRIALSQHLERN